MIFLSNLLCTFGFLIAKDTTCLAVIEEGGYNSCQICKVKT